jgi:hypothetical protein
VDFVDRVMSLELLQLTTSPGGCKTSETSSASVLNDLKADVISMINGGNSVISK